jgi:protein-L-isoaspartate(D-aspartate) O-methyltransferase
MDDLNDIRHRYAAEIEALANLQSEALATAFARVPREHFLGRGPWQILRPGIEDGDYRTTRDDDPVHLYQDVPVAIDPSRRLNKGYALGFFLLLLSSIASVPETRGRTGGCARP